MEILYKFHSNPTAGRQKSYRNRLDHDHDDDDKDDDGDDGDGEDDDDGDDGHGDHERSCRLC